jgi:hypothetical protein
MAAADRNLLFGLLALQNGLIDQGARRHGHGPVDTAMHFKREPRGIWAIRQSKIAANRLPRRREPPDRKCLANICSRQHLLPEG